MIELLAVIVILKIIEDSKKNEFLQTGNGIIDAAEYYYMKEMSDGAKPTEEKKFTFSGSKSGLEGLEFDGEIPKEGTITIDINGKVELVAHNNQLGPKPTKINGIDGYWTLSSSNDVMAEFAIEVYSGGSVSERFAIRDNSNGVRPVITLKI